jgi:addiction module RelB/DinJ family antitoxin
MASSMVHIRVDGEIKEQAAGALATMGLTVSDAVRILLTRIAAEKAMPRYAYQTAPLLRRWRLETVVRFSARRP